MYEQFSGMVDYLLDKGEKRGEKRGINLGKREVSLNMKKLGYPFDAIVAAVNLDPQIVRRWLYESEDE